MFGTNFDATVANNAQVELGDSGGAAFHYDPTAQHWVLQGIIGGLAYQDANYAVTGDLSAMLDVADDATQINAVVAAPEPSSLLLLSAGGLLVLRRRRKSC